MKAQFLHRQMFAIKRLYERTLRMLSSIRSPAKIHLEHEYRVLWAVSDKELVGQAAAGYFQLSQEQTSASDPKRPLG
jgi:hypothetical protein